MRARQFSRFQQRPLQLPQLGLVAALLFCSAPTSARAELVLTGGNIFTEAISNESVGDQDTRFGITSFQSDSLSASAGGSQNLLDYAYTQASGVTTLRWDLDQQQDGTSNASATFRVSQSFKAETNGTFTFTSNYNGLGTPGAPAYSFFLQDLTTLQFVFSDNSDNPADTDPVEDHFGSLIAGHNYVISGSIRLRESRLGEGPSSAEGLMEFIFTEEAITPEPVPEPGTLILASVALGGLGASHLARRRVARGHTVGN